MRRRRPTSYKVAAARAEPRPASFGFLLEQGTLKGFRKNKKITAEILRFHWTYYSELAYQRDLIKEKIREVLSQAATSDFSFERWQRAVKYKYGLHPLSTVGSTKDPAGGRFNIGDINSDLLPKFPALYIASDKETALAETLGQETIPDTRLSFTDLALMNPQSEVIVSVSGRLEKVFDLRRSSHLEKLVALMRDFTLSDKVYAMAKTLRLAPPEIVQTPAKLVASLLNPRWRDYPMVVDIPANCQIFGQLVFGAEIEGIIYPSTYTQKECLALYPKNFAGTSSYIQLDDEPPHPVVPRRVDSSNVAICDLSPADLFNDGTGRIHH